MENLCLPCFVTDDIEDKVEPKQIVYKLQSDNLKEIVEELNNKNCQDNYYILAGNDNPKTATDRFDELSYEKLLKQIEEEELILPPTEPED